MNAAVDEFAASHLEPVFVFGDVIMTANLSAADGAPTEISGTHKEQKQIYSRYPEQRLHYPNSSRREAVPDRAGIWLQFGTVAREKDDAKINDRRSDNPDRNEGGDIIFQSAQPGD